MSDLEAEFARFLGDQFITYIGREEGTPKPKALKDKEIAERERRKELRLLEQERRRQARMRQEQEEIERLMREGGPEDPFFKFDQVARVVCAAHNVSMEAVLADNRRPAIVRARGHLMYLARKHLNMGWTEIGRLMRRDHSTIINGVTQFTNRYTDLPVCAEVMGLLSEVIPASEPDTSS